jgi:hypothetical protein
MFDRVTTGDETWCFQYNLETKRQSMQWKTQNSPRLTKARMSHSQVHDHACVFLWSQGDSSVWIHCTRTNSESTVLFGNNDKVMGICLVEKTQTLAWQLDSPPWQYLCAWCVKISRVPG